MAPTPPRPPAETLFVWEGRDATGKKSRGEIRAANEAAARLQLRRQGIQVDRLKNVKMGRGRIVRKEIALFTRQLATMLQAGVPLLQAFDIAIRSSANPALARLLNEVRTHVAQGNPLSSAFSRFPEHFDRLYVALVAAGEHAGILDRLLERLATHQEKILAIQGKIRSALFYPTAVIVVAILVVALMMIFVIPQFKEIFASFGADLPLPTLVVIALSEFFVAWWWAILLAVTAAVILFLSLYRRSPALRDRVDHLLLRLPVVGLILTKAAIARWARTLATMFAAGVPLNEALVSVAAAAGNARYRDATRTVEQQIVQGVSLAVAMTETGVFPPMAAQMVSIGEESGQLDTMLTKVAEYYEREVDEAVASLSQLLEPVILVFLGVVIGGIVVAMYLPIFKMGEAVG
ncbi:MAG: type II secretion system F family protein [Hydrogenophilus sp.]|nr:type II secretion system F family protein [Hydrogenophilus sp.]